MKYKIVDTLIEVNLNKELEEIWEPFLCDEEGVDIKVEIIMSPEIVYGIDVLNIQGMSHSLRSGDALLFADVAWENGRIYGMETQEISTLLEMQLYSYLISKNTLLVHSALVDYQGQGIMFTGPSGVGKTTQAELWNKYENAEILNGDLVFVRKIGNSFYGYGSPWHGSSPYYNNHKVELRIIVRIDQDQETTLKELSGFKAVQVLMDQIFFAHWDKEIMINCLDTLDQIIKQCQVYFLKCKIDKETIEKIKMIL